MANPSPTPPGNPRGHLSRSTVFPLLSNPTQLGGKGHLIPGVVTMIATAALFAALQGGKFFSFTDALAYYITFIQCLIVYLLCGRRRLWLPMVAVFVVAYGLWFTPLFSAMAPVFRFALTTSLQESADFIPRFTGFFFTAGLLEELYKALPLLALAAFALYRRTGAAAPGGLAILAEPLDGIALGVAAGAAFAMCETLTEYLPKVMDLKHIAEILKTDHEQGQLRFMLAQGTGLQLLIVRLASQIAGHLAYSGYFGYFIGLAVLRPKSAPQLILIGLVSAAVLHAAWDAASGTEAVSIAIGILSYACLVAAILKARRISPSRDQNFATVVMPYVQPGPARIPQPLHVPARVPQPQPGAIVTPPRPQAPAKLILRIGPVTLNLSNGLSIEPQLLGSAGAGRGKNPIADIASNPNDATMLGLRNLSDRPYRATLINGKTVDLTNGQSVLLAPGIVIDFGGIKGVVQAG